MRGRSRCNSFVLRLHPVQEQPATGYGPTIPEPEPVYYAVPILSRATRDGTYRTE